MKRTEKGKVDQHKLPDIWKWLVCPKTHSRLVYDAQTSELVSLAARLAYPVRSGIPVLLVEEAREIDDCAFLNYAS